MEAEKLIDQQNDREAPSELQRRLVSMINYNFAIKLFFSV
jgi:hypothetical protein